MSSSTLDLAHARELARGAVAAGEMPVAYGGDGLVAAVADAVRGHRRGASGVLPGGRGNDFARCLGLPLDPVDGRRGSGPRHARPRSTWARPATTPFSGSPPAGSTPRPTGSPTQRGSSAAASSTPTAACGRWPAGSRPRSRCASTAIDHALYGYTVSVANAAMHGGGMLIAPDASLHDGAVRRRDDRRPPQAPLPAPACRPSSRARMSQQDEVTILRGTQRRAQRRPAVHDLRRRRPARRAAGDAARAAGRGARDGSRRRCLGGRPSASMTALAHEDPDRARGRRRRRAQPGAAAGPACPARCCCGSSPTRSASSHRGCAHGSAVISATNGKTTTAAITATILERAGRTLVHNRAGANMAGGIASTLLAAARPRGGIAGDTGLFEVDEFWLDAVTEQVQPRAAPAREPLPRPARSLRRARDDRRPLGRASSRGLPRLKTRWSSTPTIR